MLRLLLTPEYPAFSYEVDLSGTRYRLSWQWNERAQWWTLSIALGDGTPLASGLRVVTRTALPSYRNDERLPKGAIVAVDMNGEGRDIETREELGGRVQVFYLEPEEFPAVAESGFPVKVREA